MARPSKYDTATQERAVRMYFDGTDYVFMDNQSYEQLQAAYEEQAKEVAKLRRANEILKTASAFSPKRSSTANFGSRGFHPHLPEPLRGLANLRNLDCPRHRDCPEHLLRPPVPRLRPHRSRTRRSVRRPPHLPTVGGKPQGLWPALALESSHP